MGVFARGGRGRQVLVVIDGIRVSDPASSSQEYDLRLLNTANIASIEIIKGAASILYGTNAATAVINITTKKPSKKEISATFQSSIGTYQTTQDQNYNLSDFNNSAFVNGSLDKFYYAVGFANSFSDGISSLVTTENETDAFSRINTDVRLGYAFTKNFSISVFGNQTKLNTEYDETFGFVDAPYRFLSEQLRVGVSSELTYGNGSVNLNAAHTEYDSENISAFPNIFKGDNFVLDVYNKYTFNDQLYTILGLNYIRDRADFESLQEFTLTDPYLNLVYVSDFGLNINTGIRLNLHSEYGTHLVYNVNPSYAFSTEQGYVKVFGSSATSYITPSLTQLFGVFGPNPDLEPEENRTLEGGIEVVLAEKLRLSSLYFSRNEKNAVGFVNGQYENISDEIDAKGVEVEVGWNLTSALELDVNYTFTERKGDNAIRIPKHKLNAVLGYTLSEKTFISLDYSYTGARTDTDFNTFADVNLDPFSLVGSYISHEVITDRLKVFLNANNVFNTDFTEVLGFTTRGRNFRIGMNIKF